MNGDTLLVALLDHALTVVAAGGVIAASALVLAIEAILLILILRGALGAIRAIWSR
jgi:hypothetical protein